MKELRFDQTYTRDQAGTYTKLPFDMPGEIERIELEYDYLRHAGEEITGGTTRREINIVDLGIYDQDGRLYGWSGSNRLSVYISATSASPGYRHGKFKSGKWAVALGLYKIESRVEVRVRLRMYPRERLLLRGDLHIHTLNSDGAYTTAFVIQSGAQAGLDFIALTDHNNMKQNTEIGNPEGITVIPGVEFTNYRGHANIFFTDPAAEFNDDFLVNSFDEMAALFRRAKAAGAFISLNHPITDCSWEFGFEGFPYDMLEVWNGPMRSFNLQSIALWHRFLCEGKKLPAVGGSDTHWNDFARIFGTPCNFVYSYGRSAEDILDGLKRGRNSIAYAPGGPHLNLDIGGAGLGDTAALRPGLEGEAVVNGACQGDIVKLVSRKGAEEFDIPFTGTWRRRFPADNAGFYRLELYRRLGDSPMLTALSNPVYVEKQDPR
jgi:hypothetical protein